jgi:hypothetical protein
MDLQQNPIYKTDMGELLCCSYHELLFLVVYEFMQNGVYNKGNDSRKRDVFAGYYNIQKDEGI